MRRAGWWRSVPQWSLYFLMPLASLQTCLALYHPNTMRRRPGIVCAEWLARAKCRPWVVQATSMQVWGAVWEAGCNVCRLSRPSMYLPQQKGLCQSPAE